jgi:carboxyl-terminal processing protease
MLPASNRGVGMNIGFPDVCLTPPAAVPVPYPNFAMNVLAAPFVPNVLISMMPALNLASKIVMTTGDEPGVMGPWIKLMGAYTMGNPVVSVGGLPGINLLCPTTGNNMNNALGAVLVPSITTVLYTQRPAWGEALPDGDGYDRAVSVADLRALGAAPAPRGELLREGIGYVAVGLFTFDLPTWFYNEIVKLEGAGMRVLVLDLRGNPGGDLDACARLAGDFLDEGAEILRLTDSDGDETVRSAPPGRAYGFPLVVLVDGATASAAEIFAGCLKAHRRAAVVGETTHGKGAVQRVMPGPAGGAVYTTVARCALVGDAPLDGVGIHPDVEVRRDAAGGDSEDAQRDAALAVALALDAALSAGN